MVRPKGSVEGARVEGAAAAADRATALADLAAMMGAVTRDRYDSYTDATGVKAPSECTLGLRAWERREGAE